MNFKDPIHTSKIHGHNFPEFMKAIRTNLGPISFSVCLSNDKFRAPWSRNGVMQVLSHNSNKMLNQQTDNNIIDNNKNKTNILLSFPTKTPLLISEASFIFFHVIFFSFFAFLSAGSSSRLICTGDFVWAAGKKADPQARGTQSPLRGARPRGDAENCSACFYTGNH